MLRDSALEDHPRTEDEGGCNVQFALDPPLSFKYLIEVNPVSRSSALASKASGYPSPVSARRLPWPHALTKSDRQHPGLVQTRGLHAHMA